MAQFAYTVINKDGAQAKGEMEASDAESVRARLKLEGYVIVSIRKVNIFTRDLALTSEKKVKARDLSVFCRQFAAILSAGVPVVQALTILQEQTENKTLQTTLLRTAENVRQGMTLAESMEKFPKIFPDMFVSMVAAGEKSGNLDLCISRMGHQFEKDEKLSGMMKRAMIYPIAVVIIALVVMIVMSIVVVPKFADMFMEMGADLPLATRVLMAMSDLFLHKWYILGAVVLSIWAIIDYSVRTEGGKAFYGKLALKLPLFGVLNTKNYCAKFARTMSTLVSSSMNITEALDITIDTMKNVHYKNALAESKKMVEQGVPLSRPMKDSGVFPPMICNMLAIGEETGHVDSMLDKVADYYEQEAEAQTANLSEAMQPIIVVVLGAIVGVMVLALYQPMINMYGGIGNL